MDWDRFGIFSIVVFLFYAVFKVAAIVIGSFIWAVGTPLTYMMLDDGARELKHWHDEL